MADPESGHPPAVRVHKAQLEDGDQSREASGPEDPRPPALGGVLHGQLRRRSVRRGEGAGPRQLPIHAAYSHLANDTLLAAVEAGAAKQIA